jgi:hypothetical protein
MILMVILLEREKREFTHRISGSMNLNPLVR